MNRLTIIAAAMALTTAGAAQAYELPLRGDDLAAGERYSTFVHTGGIQAEGNDIGVRKHLGGGQWTGLNAKGADKKVLSNWLVYGKPIYAMASGTVVSCWRNAPQNTPGSYHPSYTAGKISGGGNHLWILQDDGVMTLYAHAQTGSIPAAICPNDAALFDNKDEQKVKNGARVTTGQFLGKIGNSGASEGGPHLHVHMQKDGKPVPMTFAHGMTTPYVAGETTLEGPWTRLSGKMIPKGDVLLWPARPKGTYTFNGIDGGAYQGLAEHMYDSGVMPTLITCESNGASYNSNWVPSQGQWSTHHGMSKAVAAEKNAFYTHQGFKRTSSYTCGSATVAVWRK